MSLGVQALDDADLRALGRLHTAEEAFRAVEIARATFPRISFDLIYARPGQTPEMWAAELRSGHGARSDHLSLYQLTIEPARAPPPPPPPHTMFEKLCNAGKLVILRRGHRGGAVRDHAGDLRRAWRPAYEISNHVAPGAECRHNPRLLALWRICRHRARRAWQACVVDGRRHATATAREPEKWMARVESWGDGVDTDDVLTPDEPADEMLLMGLRLVEGIDLRRYRAIAGRPLDPSRLADLIAHGMVERLGPQRGARHPRRLVRARRRGRRPRRLEAAPPVQSTGAAGKRVGAGSMTRAVPPEIS